MKLDKDFYLREDVVLVARELLGKVLYTFQDGALSAGIITETEAYNGIEDKASHAYGNRRTQRTEVMYAAGGIAYVYFCYGLHHLVNVVTGREGNPQAVLVRAMKPVLGIDVMLIRRKMQRNSPLLSNGPGKLSQALGITGNFNGLSLLGQQIWIEAPLVNKPFEIVTRTRIGIDYAEEHVYLPYRFYIKDEKYISKP